MLNFLDFIFIGDIIEKYFNVYLDKGIRQTLEYATKN